MSRMHSVVRSILAFAVLSLSADAFAAKKAKNPKTNLTWTDPITATAEDPDFSIQGEYGRDAANQPWAVQVVALGDGSFDAYLLERGLPGLGWDKSKLRIKLSGNRDGESVKLATKDKIYRVTISDGVLVAHQYGDVIARLRRIQRQSSTLGAPAPKGAVVLFNGRSADEWNNGRIENGLLANNDPTTKRKFGSYHLHLEFRTPYKPFARGQGRGNSGVYHQGRFETQVLDAFGLEGKMNETGGIYSIAHPRINMCLPPLRWQTYDVDFVAAKFDQQGELLKHASMTVKLNGVEVHTNQELNKSTTAARAKGLADKGPIYLQHHGNPVYYRNIWIVEKE
jgi:hypothetical protein